MLGIGARFGVPRWRARRAQRSAELLDEVVDAQLPLLSSLAEDSRRRAADYLAELVMLGQAYRHYAAGWIDRRELERRGSAAVARLNAMRQQRPPAAQFTERD
ncbi:hypothetical protein [Gandjariella thermophila]|uniref:Uncharacterized protein n=1 Tax=Gandjariella thermophila TaxID=1931992 RepID=A0A4D4J9P3_9PSEU|nr:hypothetical protein [Gandjariella thermophila]GDY31129.1 hypothetical protein GTS_27620 [Gandjariella thermophila]